MDEPVAGPSQIGIQAFATANAEALVFFQDAVVRIDVSSLSCRKPHPKILADVFSVKRHTALDLDRERTSRQHVASEHVSPIPIVADGVCSKAYFGQERCNVLEIV